VSFAAPVLKTQEVGAWTGDIQTCNLPFDAFNWKDQIRDHAVNTAKQSPDTVQTVIIYRYPGEGNNKFTVDMLPTPYLAAFTQADQNPVTGEYAKSVEYSLTAGSSQTATEFEVDLGAKTVVNNGNVPVDPGKFKFGSSGNGNISELSCIQTAKGFTQPFIWNGKSISESVPTQGGEKCNGALDFGCWIGKAFNGIGDGFNAVGRAIVQGIASIFMPDGNKIKADFDSLTSFMTAKLGFLTFPFQFLNDMYNGFNDTSNNWCNSTSCVKNFGNLYGQPFTVNFKQGETAYPAIWTYFLAAIRGVTVLGVVFAVRHKYLEIVNK
jgi:hypothetical protein